MQHQLSSIKVRNTARGYNLEFPTFLTKCASKAFTIIFNEIIRLKSLNPSLHMYFIADIGLHFVEFSINFHKFQNISKNKIGRYVLIFGYLAEIKKYHTWPNLPRYDLFWVSYGCVSIWRPPWCLSFYTRKNMFQFCTLKKCLKMLNSTF